MSFAGIKKSVTFADAKVTTKPYAVHDKRFIIKEAKNSTSPLRSVSSAEMEETNIYMENQEQTQLTGNRSLDMCRRTVTTESFIAEAN